MNNHVAVKNEKHIELTPSLENYLEAIYTLEQAEGKSVRLTDISQQLSVTKTSVNRAICSLKQYGLVHHEHYGTVSLTSKGKRYAQSIYRSHVIIRTFLIKLLDVDPDTADREACMMEHFLCASTIDKWELFIDGSCKCALA